jgi:polysaccharide biosynthesis/export protein
MVVGLVWNCDGPGSNDFSNRGGKMNDAPYAAHPAKLLILTLILSPLTCARGHGNSLDAAKQQHVQNVHSRPGAPATSASSDPAKANSSYVIGPGDLLAIDVLHEPEVSQKVPVRMDGKISMPLIGEVQASGLMPDALQANIAQKLRDYIKDAEVTVVVEEIKSRQFSVMGEVEHPGAFPLVKSTRVMDGLAQAGGFRDFAKVTKIRVLRRTPQGTTITLPFNYKNVSKGKDSSQNIELQPGDTIIVP